MSITNDIYEPAKPQSGITQEITSQKLNIAHGGGISVYREQWRIEVRQP